jgi:hypothetical protein
MIFTDRVRLNPFHKLLKGLDKTAMHRENERLVIGIGHIFLQKTKVQRSNEGGFPSFACAAQNPPKCLSRLIDKDRQVTTGGFGEHEKAQEECWNWPARNAQLKVSIRCIGESSSKRPRKPNSDKTDVTSSDPIDGDWCSGMGCRSDRRKSKVNKIQIPTVRTHFPDSRRFSRSDQLRAL